MLRPRSEIKLFIRVNYIRHSGTWNCCPTQLIARYEGYNSVMELFTTVVLALVAMVVGIGLVIYGVKGRRESQARDGRTYKRGRI
jgi:hypothetical protein